MDLVAALLDENIFLATFYVQTVVIFYCSFITQFCCKSLWDLHGKVAMVWVKAYYEMRNHSVYTFQILPHV